ncbi:hypothetical protein D5F01_LYC10055 [Larimichthys crocea]|uniref:Ig-like domain-containing protein n=1 Tax=Larimichthys crocea TaxID=215358 RepID=A0A6G0IGC3_LARCR|nr:hypothetical protein D5F01_LYC10055 [Larimichthys crocea]
MPQHPPPLVWPWWGSSCGLTSWQDGVQDQFFHMVLEMVLDVFQMWVLMLSYEQVVKPVVSVYPAASRAHLEGKSSLLCLASAMFPPLVKFSWKRQKEDGPLEEVHRDVGEQLELRESGRTASILLIHGHESSTYKYRCSVQHEGGHSGGPNRTRGSSSSSLLSSRERASRPASSAAS